MSGITLTVDLEDPTEDYRPDGRFVENTRAILNLCRELNRKATFFTVGRLAEAAPNLIRDIAADGHEIAYHSHAHRSLTEETVERFKSESAIDKDRLEQLAGKAVIGFRAPRFSLTPASVWTLDILAELGFRYSSSIMPTHISRFGFPGTSRTPFKWWNGMTEFPVPVASFCGHDIPYLGGIYLYAPPAFATRYFLKKTDPNVALWTYTHPYDLDRTEKFSAMPNTPLWISAVLWAARRVAEKKLRTVLMLENAPPLGDRLL